MSKTDIKKRLEEIIALAGEMRYELLVEEAKESYAPKISGSAPVDRPAVGTTLVDAPVVTYGETCAIDPSDRCEKCLAHPWQVKVGNQFMCLTCMTNLV